MRKTVRGLDDRQHVFPNGRGKPFTGSRVDVKEQRLMPPDQAALPGRKCQEILSQWLIDSLPGPTTTLMPEEGHCSQA